MSHEHYRDFLRMACPRGEWNYLGYDLMLKATAWARDKPASEVRIVERIDDSSFMNSMLILMQSAYAIGELQVKQIDCVFIPQNGADPTFFCLDGHGVDSVLLALEVLKRGVML